MPTKVRTRVGGHGPTQDSGHVSAEKNISIA